MPNANLNHFTGKTKGHKTTKRKGKTRKERKQSNGSHVNKFKDSDHASSHT